MACCGQKRAQLQVAHATRKNGRGEERVAVAPIDEDQSLTRRHSRIFEYLGSESLSLRGAASGVMYRFTHPGARLEVAFEDSFAMMAERSVRLA